MFTKELVFVGYSKSAEMIREKYKYADSRSMEAVDRFQFGGWNRYQCLNCKVEAEAEAVEAEEAAFKSTLQTVGFLGRDMAELTDRRWD